MCKENITFSSFFILFHPFSSKKAEKGRKRQGQEGIPVFLRKTLNLLSGPTGGNILPVQGLQKKVCFFCHPFFVVSWPSLQIPFLLGKQLSPFIPFHPFSSFFILFHPFSSKKAEKGRKTTLIIIVYLFLLAKKISLFKDKR